MSGEQSINATAIGLQGDAAKTNLGPLPSSAQIAPSINEIETFYGLIESTSDALRVFQLCRQGKLGRVRRRLHDKERKLIRSGSVFVFDEYESGIKRWTDGRLWSPSRILGNFLIYRELERKSITSVNMIECSVHGNDDTLGCTETTNESPDFSLSNSDPLMLPWLDEPIMASSAQCVVESAFQVYFIF